MAVIAGETLECATNTRATGALCHMDTSEEREREHESCEMEKHNVPNTVAERVMNVQQNE